MPAPLAFPTLLAHHARHNEVTGIKRSLETARTELVTGRAADQSSAVDGRIGRIHRLEQSLAYSQERQRQLDFAGDRMDATQVVLQKVRDDLVSVADDFAEPQLEEFRQALGVASVQAYEALVATVGAFNTGYAGRKLFSGDRSDVNPLGDPDTLIAEARAVAAAAPPGGAVAALDSYFDDPAGGFMTSFYQGGTEDGPTVEVSAGHRVQTDLRGDHAAIRSALKSLTMGVLASDAALSADARDELATKTFSELNKAQTDVLEGQTRIGAAQRAVEEGLVRHQAEETVTNAALEALIGVDQFEAATRLSDLTNQLEAAYATTARLAGLSLSNYLR